MEKQTKLHTIANHSNTIPCLISFILLLLSNGSVYCNAFTTSTKQSLFSIRSYTQNKKSSVQQPLKMAGFPPPMGGPMRDGPPMGQRSFGGPDGMGPPPMGDGAYCCVKYKSLFFYCVGIVVSFCVGYDSWFDISLSDIEWMGYDLD